MLTAVLQEDRTTCILVGVDSRWLSKPLLSSGLGLNRKTTTEVSEHCSAHTSQPFVW